MLINGITWVHELQLEKLNIQMRLQQVNNKT